MPVLSDTYVRTVSVMYRVTCRSRYGSSDFTMSKLIFLRLHTTKHVVSNKGSIQ